MYKSTANNMHWLPRTGSFSTHPHRNGRVDVLPKTAKAQIFQDFEQRRNVLVARLNAVKSAMADMAVERESPKMRRLHRLYSIADERADLKCEPRPQKPQELEDFDRRYAALRTECRELEGELSKYKADRKRNYLQSFSDVAEQMLDTETFLRIATEAKRRCGQQ